ncbi:uncharacterized protein LOC129582468 [Paramacrobiotus metropolitanus]|uniref:uncharacterized protein LOC129582468 n=1 Tax=Paramacrobiotus metropolitanus TaxID=2943436 RepID=UPI002445EDC7|nr:uncharacterized protein LOC129582468 [Paramacrobiotus metropolitanus]
MMQYWCSVVLLGAVFITSDAAGLQVQYLVILPNDPSFGPSIPRTGGALNYSLQLVNRKYGGLYDIRFTALYLAEPARSTCGYLNGASPRLLAEHYFRDQVKSDGVMCHAVIMAACSSLQIQNIASLAREFGMTLFVNGIGFPDYVDEQAYPSSIMIGGTYGAVAEAVLGVAGHFAWRHLSILRDNATFTVLYSLFDKGMHEQAGQQPRGEDTGFRLETLLFNGTDNDSIEVALISARRRSRVIILMCDTSVARRVLALAAARGFDNGQYVFLNVQGMQQAGSYGRFSDFDNPSPELLNISRSTFFLVSHTESKGKHTTNDYLIAYAKRVSNFTFPDDEKPLDAFAAQNSVNAVEVYAKMVTESLVTDGVHACRQTGFTRAAAANKTFTTSLGQVHIDAQRTHSLDVDVYAFDLDSLTMQQYALYDSQSRGLNLTDAVNISWLAGGVPPDVPVCGYSDAEGPCAVTGSPGIHTVCLFPVTFSVTISVAGVSPLTIVIAVVCGTILAFFMLIITQYARRLLANTRPWWLISADDFARDSTASLSMISGKKYAIWKGQPVWIKPVPLHGKPVFRQLCSTIQLLEVPLLMHTKLNKNCSCTRMSTGFTASASPIKKFS